MFFLCPIVFFAQGQEIENLVNLIEQSYDAPNPHESLALVENIGDLELLPDTSRYKFLIAKAIAYGKLGESDSSFHYVDQCIEYATLKENDFYRIRAYNVEGIVWRVQGEHEKALAAFQNAEKIMVQSSEEGVENSISTLLGNIGGIFYQLGDYESAKQYSIRGLASAKKFADSTSIAFSHLRLAIIAQEEDSLELSLRYSELAENEFEQLRDFASLAYVQNNLGDLYSKEADYTKAIGAYKSALQFAETSGDDETYVHASIAMAEAYYHLEQFSSALLFVDNALSTADEAGYSVQSRNGHQLRYQIFKAMGDFNKALEEKELAVIISDSLNSVETRERISELEIKYESVKKEAEITRLEAENQLASAQAEESRRLTVIAIVGAILLILFVVILYMLRLKKASAERQVKEQQYDALQKRYVELLNGPQTFAIADDIESLNKKVVNPLTEREFETLSLGLKGKSNKEIADRLFVSESTVKFHLRNVYNKLGVANRKEALEYVVRAQ